MDSGAATGMEARTRPAAGQLCTEKSAGLARRPTERLAEPLKAQPFRQPGEPVDRSLGVLKIVLYLVPTQLLWLGGRPISELAGLLHVVHVEPGALEEEPGRSGPWKKLVGVGNAHQLEGFGEFLL